MGIPDEREARADQDLRVLPFEAADFLAAIVASSDDAIVSKNLSGVITTWNKGAERIFGYTADESVGQPITIVIPEDRKNEEPSILARIQAGERVDHFETVRRRKDGTLIDISLTISPIVDSRGRIIGASKIARDISDSKRHADERELLLRELHHRIKNLFSVTGSIIALAARNAATPGELALEMRERLSALARAHEITLPTLTGHAPENRETSLFQLLSSILAPYGQDDRRPWTLSGEDVTLQQGTVTNLALLFHEFATNSSKYGALSVENGTLDIRAAARADRLEIVWLEANGPTCSDVPPASSSGFGRILEATLSQSLNARIERTWMPAGVSIHVVLNEVTTK